MRSSRKSLAGLLALAAIGGSLPAGYQAVEYGPSARASADQARSNPSSQQAAGGVVDRAMQAVFGGGGYGPCRRTFPGLGWSVAVDRRRAKKARNVRRNRRAHRG